MHKLSPEQLVDIVLKAIRKQGFPYVSFEGATLRPLSETEFAGELHCSDAGARHWDLGVQVTITDNAICWHIDSGDQGAIAWEDP